MSVGSWTHWVCDECYSVEKPGQEPIRVDEEYRIPMACCLCEEDTTAGIYYRKNPDETLCGGNCLVQE